MDSTGNPFKEGFDVSGWDVHILDNDTRIDRLIDAQGIAAFTVYFYLCQHAYATHGYYLEWSYSLCPSVARKLGKGARAEFVKNVVDMCFQCCLFDQRLFDSYGILTNRDMQQAYYNAAGGREIDSRFWLPKKDEHQGPFPCAQNCENPTENDDFQTENPDFQPGNDRNERDEKKERNERNERKESNQRKESKESQEIKKSRESKEFEPAYAGSCPEPENSASGPPPVIALPLNDNTEYEVPQKDFDSWVSLYPAVDVMQQLRNMKGWLQANPDRRKTRRGINRFISGWLSREQDRGGARPAAQAARPMSQGQAQGDQVLAALREMYEQADGGMPPMEMGG